MVIEPEDDETTYLLRREAEERAAAAEAACMARTAHLDMADMYAERRLRAADASDMDPILPALDH